MTDQIGPKTDGSGTDTRRWERRLGTSATMATRESDLSLVPANRMEIGNRDYLFVNVSIQLLSMASPDYLNKNARYNSYVAIYYHQPTAHLKVHLTNCHISSTQSILCT